MYFVLCTEKHFSEKSSIGFYRPTERSKVQNRLNITARHSYLIKLANAGRSYKIKILLYSSALINNILYHVPCFELTVGFNSH